jgi:uncharacterized Zn finger protein
VSDWFVDQWRSAVDDDLGIDAAMLRQGRNLVRRLRPTVEVEPGGVSARYSSTREAAVATVGLAPIDDGVWQHFGAELGAKPALLASVLTGELPAGIEDAADPAGLRLVPSRSTVSWVCSCEGWDDPCVHVAGVLHVMADLIEADPFAVLVFMGRSRESLVETIHRVRSGVAADPTDAASSGEPRGADPGVSASSAFARHTPTLPRPHPIPRRAAPPVDLRSQPPADSGVRASDLAGLVADAADRATGVLQGRAETGLSYTVEADVVRRAARLTGSRLETLADQADLDPDELAARARAWALAGAEGLAAHDHRWDPPDDLMTQGVDALGGRARRSGNALLSGAVQLRVDPSRRWWRFEPHQQLGWILASEGFDDPADAVPETPRLDAEQRGSLPLAATLFE